MSFIKLLVSVVLVYVCCKIRTAGVEGSLQDPVLWSRNTDDWRASLPSDGTDGSMHSCVRNVPVLTVNQDELAGYIRICGGFGKEI